MLDVWQVHTYPKEDGGAAFRDPGSPVLTDASAYAMVGPIIIGEVSTRWVEKPNGEAPVGTVTAGAGASMAALHEGALTRGFAGCFRTPRPQGLCAGCLVRCSGL